MKRVAIVTTIGALPWGGSEELWKNFSHELLENQNQVFCSVFNWKSEPKHITDLREKGAVIHKRNRFQYPTFKGKIKGFVNRKLFGLKQLSEIKKFNPDFVFFSCGGAFDTSAFPYNDFIFSLNCPFGIYLSLNTEFEVLPFDVMKIQKKVFEDAKFVIFPSQRNLYTAKRQLCSNISNGIVLNNPITFKDISPLTLPVDSKIKFASVARLDAFVKGQGVLLEIFAQEKWKNRNFELNIFGSGDDLNYLKELTKFYDLQDKVNFKGQVSDIRKDIWADNHVLLMPSQYEGCPISLYDAAICSRPAVVSDVGGNAEFVENEINGFVSEAPSVLSFGKALEKMWEHKNKIKILGENAREKALNTLNLNPHLEVLNQIEN